MLKICNLQKTFAPGTPNEHLALAGLNLTVGPGEFVSIIGSNGAGKSTLFGAVAGEFWPDSGSIFLDGQNITYAPEHKRAGQIGRLFQDPMKGTAPNMTVEENLALAYSRSKRRGLNIALTKTDRAYFKEALARYDMGLEERLSTKVGLLSGGQRQALTLLMSTIVSPKLLLLDEHTAALDPATAEKVLAITRQVVKEGGLTTLMITHNITQALNMGSRTVMMDAGQIILDITGPERAEMTVEKLMKRYGASQKKALDNDRMLFGAG